MLALFFLDLEKIFLYMPDKKSFNFEKILLRKFYFLCIFLKLLIIYQTYSHILNLSTKTNDISETLSFNEKSDKKKSLSDIENIPKNVTGRAMILNLIKLDLIEVNKH